MIPTQNMALGAPAISPNGSAPHCEHLDGLQPVTPCQITARTAAGRTAGRPSWSCLTCGWVAWPDDSPNQHARWGDHEFC